MRDQQDDNKQTRQASQPQPAGQTNERKRRYETLNGVDDEPQICRGID